MKMFPFSVDDAKKEETKNKKGKLRCRLSQAFHRHIQIIPKIPFFTGPVIEQNIQHSREDMGTLDGPALAEAVLGNAAGALGYGRTILNIEPGMRRLVLDAINEISELVNLLQ